MTTTSKTDKTGHLPMLPPEATIVELSTDNQLQCIHDEDKNVNIQQESTTASIIISPKKASEKQVLDDEHGPKATSTSSTSSISDKDGLAILSEAASELKPSNTHKSYEIEDKEVKSKRRKMSTPDVVSFVRKDHDEEAGAQEEYLQRNLSIRLQRLQELRDTTALLRNSIPFDLLYSSQSVITQSSMYPPEVQNTTAAIPTNTFAVGVNDPTCYSRSIPRRTNVINSTVSRRGNPDRSQSLPTNYDDNFSRTRSTASWLSPALQESLHSMRSQSLPTSYDDNFSTTRRIASWLSSALQQESDSSSTTSSMTTQEREMLNRLALSMKRSNESREMFWSSINDSLEIQNKKKQQQAKNIPQSSTFMQTKNASTVHHVVRGTASAAATTGRNRRVTFPCVLSSSSVKTTKRRMSTGADYYYDKHENNCNFKGYRSVKSVCLIDRRMTL